MVQFDAYVRRDTALASHASVLELLLRLRQACDHPFLVNAYADAYAPGPPYRTHWIHVVSLRLPHRP